MTDLFKTDIKIINPIKFKKNPRGLSRLLALQILFQNDFFENDVDLNLVTKDLINNYLIHEDHDFVDLTLNIEEIFITKLVKGVLENIDEFDLKIASFLKAKYSIETIDNVELQIFRLAMFELKFLNETPTNVIINEYVDIASGFFIEKKINFINGLINSLAKDLRKP